MHCTFPAAYYGYYPAGTGQYGFDFRFHDLPLKAQLAFRQLKEQFQWSSSGGQGHYADCYAIWPVNSESVLAIRFRDVGGDANYNRPHTLRIEAVLVSRNDVPAWPVGLVRLLSENAWKNVDTSGDPGCIQLNLADEPTNISDKIREGLARESVPAILLAPHAHIMAKAGFQIVQTTDNGIKVHCREVKEVPSNRKVPDSRPLYDNTRQRRLPEYVSKLVVLLIGLGIGFGGSHQAWVKPLEQVVNSKANKIERLNDENEKLVSTKSELELKNRNLEKESGEMKPKANNWDSLVRSSDGKVMNPETKKEFDKNSTPADFEYAVDRLQTALSESEDDKTKRLNSKIARAAKDYVSAKVNLGSTQQKVEDEFKKLSEAVYAKPDTEKKSLFPNVLQGGRFHN